MTRRSRFALRLFAGLLLLGIPHAWPAGAETGTTAEVEADELLVGFLAGVAAEDAETIYRGYGAARLEQIGPLPIHRIRVPPGALRAVEQALARHPEIKFVERNRQTTTDATPNDPLYINEWHLTRISAPAAWDITTGKPEVIIAIIDSGIEAWPGSHGRVASCPSG